MFRKTIVAVSILSLAGIMSACSSAEQPATQSAAQPATQSAATTTTTKPAPAPAAKPEPTTTKPAPTKQAVADKFTPIERLFISHIDSQGVYYSSEEALVKVGHMTCETFDVGATFTQVAMAARNGGVSSTDAAILIGSSIGAFCPEHADKLQ